MQDSFDSVFDTGGQLVTVREQTAKLGLYLESCDKYEIGKRAREISDSKGWPTGKHYYAVSGKYVKTYRPEAIVEALVQLDY